MIEIWLLFCNPDVELARFPSNVVVAQWSAFAVEHCEYVELRRWLNSDDPQYFDYFLEAKKREYAWELLGYAQLEIPMVVIDESTVEYCRRIRAERLRELRVWIGEDRFRLGIMPAPAPFLDDIWFP